MRKILAALALTSFLVFGGCEKEERTLRPVPVNVENDPAKIDRKVRFSVDRMREIIMEDPYSFLPYMILIWKAEYSDRHAGSLETSLRRAIAWENIQKAREGVEKALSIIKRRHRLDEDEEAFLRKILLLAIPESHFSAAVSPAGARGPYQILPSTARSLGLKANYDHDVMESAKGAVLLIYDNYRRLKDWDLAVAAYNSGMPWRYSAAMGGRNLSYVGYLRFLVESKSKRVKVRRGDTLWSILNRNGIATPENLRWVKVINKIKDDTIYPGQVLTLPVEVYAFRRSAIVENLNYPAKFYAILELLDEKYPEVIDFALGKIDYDSLVKGLEKKGLKRDDSLPCLWSQKRGVRYVVKPGDSAWKILTAFGVDPTLSNYRRIFGPSYRNLRPGQVFYIPVERRFRPKPNVKTVKNRLRH